MLKYIPCFFLTAFFLQTFFFSKKKKELKDIACFVPTVFFVPTAKKKYCAYFFIFLSFSLKDSSRAKHFLQQQKRHTARLFSLKNSLCAKHFLQQQKRDTARIFSSLFVFSRIFSYFLVSSRIFSYLFVFFRIFLYFFVSFCIFLYIFVSFRIFLFLFAKKQPFPNKEQRGRLFLFFEMLRTRRIFLHNKKNAFLPSKKYYLEKILPIPYPIPQRGYFFEVADTIPYPEKIPPLGYRYKILPQKDTTPKKYPL